jgi:hypothetical protein
MLPKIWNQRRHEGAPQQQLSRKHREPENGAMFDLRKINYEPIH